MLKQMSKHYDERRGYLIGVTNEHDYIYIPNFKWECGWYWSGGDFKGHYKNRANSGGFTRFTWDKLKVKHIDLVKESFRKSTLTYEEWWRLMDLLAQFHSIKKSAEVFQYGGHYTSKGRTKAELDLGMAESMNNHIKNVIIPEIQKLLSEGLEG